MAASSNLWVFVASLAIIITGIINNGIVVGVLCLKSSRRILHKWRNMYILHQSVVDITTLVLVTLLRVIPIDEDTFRSDTFWTNLLCKFWVSEYLYWSMLTCSTYNLALLSMERYLAVVHPIAHRTKLTKNKVLLSMLFPWVIGFAVQSYWPPLHTVDTVRGTCSAMYSCANDTHSHLQTGLSIYSFTFEFGIALLVMVFAYGNIIFKLTLIIRRRRTKRRFQPNENRHPDDGTEKGGRKNGVSAISHSQQRNKNRNVFSEAKRDIIKTFLAVFASYVICWTPTEVVYLRHNLCIQELDFQSGLYDGLSILVVLNAVINPFIYTGLYMEFQKQLKRVLQCAATTSGADDDDTSGGTEAMSNMRPKKSSSEPGTPTTVI